MLMHCEDVSFLKISRELCNVEKPEYPHCIWKIIPNRLMPIMSIF
ncbi:hypothetical protein T4B_11079, partial [Trichinella pseudospiralis]